MPLSGNISMMSIRHPLRVRFGMDDKARGTVH